VNKAAQSKINSIQAAINGLKAKQQATTSHITRRQLQAQIEQKAAEREFWKGQIVEGEPAQTPPPSTGTYTTPSGNKYQFSK
jgi:hypothetical protein